MRAVFLLLLAGFAFAGEEPGLAVPLTSVRARSLREEGRKAWDAAAPVWTKAKAGEVVEPGALAAAVAAVEDAVAKWEQSLRVEWDDATNGTLAEACRAWYGMRVLLPADPADDTRREAGRRRRVQEVRKLVMEHGAARRLEMQIRRCDRCDGRGVLRAAFGDRPADCPACDRRGAVPHRGSILDAQWLVRSPLYRADTGNAVRMDLDLRRAGSDAARLAPFVQSVGIDGEVEDHDVWARVRAKEKVTDEPRGKPVTRQVEYVFFRVGRVWYLWDDRYDASVLPDPAARPATGSGPAGSTAGSPNGRG